MWRIGRETARLLVKDKPGILKTRQGRKKAHTTSSVPGSFALRIDIRLQGASEGSARTEFSVSTWLCSMLIREEDLRLCSVHRECPAQIANSQ